MTKFLLACALACTVVVGCAPKEGGAEKKKKEGEAPAAEAPAAPAEAPAAN